MQRKSVASISAIGRSLPQVVSARITTMTMQMPLAYSTHRTLSGPNATTKHLILRDQLTASFRSERGEP